MNDLAKNLQIDKVDSDKLNELLNNLKTIDELGIDENSSLKPDLTYEIEELKKDLIYLNDGVDALIEHLKSIHKNFDDEVNMVVEYLKKNTPNNFITDRDGTVNNYCQRYLTSIQSIYNAQFLITFSNKMNHSVIMTSAPLDGLRQLSIMHNSKIVNAGSKGREYIDEEGNLKTQPISDEQKKYYDVLSKKIENLVSEDKYKKFVYLGSGFQKKFGQLTLSRQDVNKTISKDESDELLNKIKAIVNEVDSNNQHFVIEDTGLDIEIILTIEKDGGKKDFDKGDGVIFLNNEIGMDIANNATLICGDTNSDVPMLAKSIEINPETKGVFVTTKDELKEKVKGVCSDAVIVSTPDVLVTALYLYSKL